MTPTTPVTTPDYTYTGTELSALRKLRTRYQQDQDLWSDRERAHLIFMRWLYQTGKLPS
jgi:hypothetical protein